MKQREKIGAFVLVPIDETYHTYGRMINRSVYAFHDCRTDSDVIDLEKIESSAILFKVMVMKSAVTSGRWKIVGARPLSDDLIAPVPFFKQEIGDPNDCSIIYVDSDQRKRVSPQECIGLERFAVWEAQHVERRLRDHYDGVRNFDSWAMRLNSM